ncbi:PREDICTED: Hermansky-Pudlak syndrome 3 protein homolog [Cyphomyrmex costatus]|uniref:Hermansky-Pudlak syndrome 3 protein like protein n=1 Tax=Cyphomyrmex costatus TaxID=456900 RepID=A0A195CU84_9HYME|nr:PREDICTED: Hermansky-Pudlak syndrome 3 protein homolog [Cyphomyrmex costatus]XP_018393807.1 PREDICTED: Hermansky-Pudlak syndrome 3 protein homolog [Cyphomyrmex costatus]XP_018393808.1 PREDICTED: Hermansky-Pudlak syndrome 3 protein homolog [Cyphomyrmex costatus]KYN04246.1 Hermansky-Pudlak syndrome 3 protein like protein [Cyphomyrmex costatus]
MVRVITVHNFLGQNVAQIEEPTATCTATSQGQEMLLLALPTHCVEVWELMNSDVKLRTVFPTVDMINQMVHCAKGDYVVTLESKYLRDTASNNHANKATSNFVRIYVNWAVAKDQSQPMRARIAGRVTPSLNRPLNSLEMIELPLSVQPTLIACCQCTGNLLIASGNSAILHEFKIETQQVSKIKFIDFEPRPWSLGFTFTPTRMEIIEDFIAIMDNTTLSVFRLTNSMYEDIDQLSSLTSTSSSVDKTSISTDSSLVENSGSLGNDDTSLQGTNIKHKSIDQDCQYVTSENNETVITNVKSKDKKHKGTKGSIWYKSETGDFNRTKASNNKNYIDWEHLICNEKDEMQRLITQGIVDPSSQPLTVNLPLISLERAGPGHALSPFILNPADIRIFIKTTSPDVGWSENYMIKNLLCLKINAGNNNAKVDGILEIFKCMVLKPLYMKKECNTTGVKKSMLRSDKYRYLQGVSCFVCTTQEGYLYHFTTANSSSVDATCLTTYPFTAPVHHVALEHTVLHALTEAGLESYTLRLSHHIAKLSNSINGMRVTCPNIIEPISLIGLRPFLGIQKLLHTKSYIVLLAKADNSWTMYSLNLPKFENVYFDMLNAARNHKSSSPSTYRHLLGEAHALIRLAKNVFYNVNNEEFDDTMHKNDLKLKNLYNQSCALLADYYIRSENESDWDLCISYYKMSGLKPSEVLCRKCCQDAPGLLTFLTDALLTMKSGSEADALFQGQNIIEIICKLETEDLLTLIFGSSVLREYATEKLINLLLTHETSDVVQLALALLYIQADKQEQAEKALEPVSVRCIKQIVLERWELLFDVAAIKKRSPMIATFSDFAGILMLIKNTTFADILIQIIEEESTLSLHQIIQVFLEYLPSRVGRDGHNAAATLQVFLEKYLHNYFSSKFMMEWPTINKNQIRSDFALIEAFKLLVRSYLGKLTQTRVYKTDSKEDQEENDKEYFMFAKYRPSYLNKMPPYAKDYQKILSMNDFKDITNFNNASENEKTIPKELFKLQSVLSCEFLPIECLHEVKQFLETQNIDGNLSLKTLCIQNTEEVTIILMDSCPQAVVQYAKDRYTKDTEWKYLIELTRDKIATSTTEQELQLLYTQIMKEILNHLPHALPMKSLHRILPRDDMAAFQRCTEMCNQIMHADHVKSLIMETGQQLLTTLKL